MIDKRFSLVPHTEHAHLFYLRFSVVLPPERYYTTQVGLINAECKKQYPELIFNYQGDYSARFPDGQYARCIQCRVKESYVEELVFSLPLQLDTIMSAVCKFKKAVPSIKLKVDPALLIDMTPDDFYEKMEDMYALVHNISLRIRAVTWQLFTCSIDQPIYFVTPTDYDYI